MKLRNIFAILFLSILISSCGNDDDQITLEETEVSYEIIQEGNFSSSIENIDLITAQYLVFKTKDGWVSYSNGPVLRSNPEQSEKFRQLDFDFERNNLVLVTSGYDETCCKSIEINKVYENQGRIYVTFEVNESDDSQEIMSQAYHYAKSG